MFVCMFAYVCVYVCVYACKRASMPAPTLPVLVVFSAQQDAVGDDPEVFGECCRDEINSVRLVERLSSLCLGNVPDVLVAQDLSHRILVPPQTQ